MVRGRLCCSTMPATTVCPGWPQRFPCAAPCVHGEHRKGQEAVRRSVSPSSPQELTCRVERASRLEGALHHPARRRLSARPAKARPKSASALGSGRFCEGAATKSIIRLSNAALRPLPVRIY